jgi:uncharacterized protein (TIGR00369 family)
MRDSGGFGVKGWYIEKMSAPKKKSPKDSQIVLNTLMMPEHANHFGNVHGGIIMKLADEAAAIAAMRHAQKPAVTVAMDSMTFKRPVNIGEIVRCTATVTYTHKSSMEVSVIVVAEEPISGKLTHTNSAHLVFVALDKEGRPSDVPEVLLSSDEERAAYAAGERRQERRLAARKAGD